MEKYVIKPIRNEQDYHLAHQEIDRLLVHVHAPGSPEDDRLEVLTTLVANYEDVHHRIPDPDPIEAIRYLMEEQGLKNKDLEPLIGPKSRVSEIMNRKKYFNLEQIYQLHKFFHLPLELFINATVLASASVLGKTSKK